MDYRDTEDGTTQKFHYGARRFLHQGYRIDSESRGNRVGPNRRSARGHDLWTLPGAFLELFEHLAGDPLIDTQYDKMILGVRMQ